MADWKVNVTLEMRDWVYGTYLPPRLIASARRATPASAAWASPSTWARRDGRLPGRLRRRPASIDTGERLQQTDRLRRRRHQPHRLRAAQRRPARACSVSSSRPSTTSSPSSRRATGSSTTRSRRSSIAGNTTMTHLLARSRPALPARRALHPRPDDAAQAGRRRARPRRERAGARAPHAGRGQLRGRRHHRRRDLVGHVRHRASSRCSSTSAPTARSCSATRTG